MAVNASPFGPKPQFELSSGLPAVGNKLFFYAAGSSTKQNTYTDSTGGSANSNPVVLNSLGQPTNELWFTAGLSYKVVYAPSTDTDPPSSPIWTIDNLRGINDTTVTQDQWVISGLTPTFISAVTFSVAGDQTSIFQVGRRIKTINSGGTVYGTISNSVFAAVTTITVVNDSGALDSGLSSVSYGLLTASNSSIPGVSLTAGNWVHSGDVTMTGASIIEAMDVTVASAATANIWATGGNTVHISGTTGISSFGSPPQAGATKRVIFDAALTLTHSAAFNLNAGGSNITVAANDYAIVTAVSTTDVLVYVFLKSGQPTSLPTLLNLSTFTNAISGNVALNNVANFFDGPTTAQGTTGTFLCIGSVNLQDTGAAANFEIKLWDNTTVIDSRKINTDAATRLASVTVAGVITNPAAGIRISVRDTTATTGLIVASASGFGKDSQLTVVRIG